MATNNPPKEQERQRTGEAPNQRGGPPGAGTGGTRVNVAYGDVPMATDQPPQGQPQSGQGQGQHRGGANAPGQQKTYTVTNPTTGEQKQVTQKEWREQKLGQQGFVKPDDLDENATS